MLEQIIKRIRLYKEGFGYERVKVVMTIETFNKIKAEVENSNNFQVDGDKTTIAGCPVEIYDKIVVDYYVTRVIDNYF